MSDETNLTTRKCYPEIQGLRVGVDKFFAHNNSSLRAKTTGGNRKHTSAQGTGEAARLK